MKVVITGATGYIGGHVLKRLSKENEVICIVRNSSNISQISNFAHRIVTVTKYEHLYAEMMEIKPDIVVHLAGMFQGEHTKESIENMLDSNIKFASILFDAAQSAGCKKFINTGSYWQNYNKDFYNPVNLYAATKQAFEDIVLYYVKAKKCKAITMQIFDSFGENDGRNKILNLVARLKDGEELDMSPGEQKLFFCYIDDIVSAYVQAIQLVSDMGEGEYYKYAIRGEKPHTLKEIVETYLRLANKKVQIRWGGREYREREIMDPEEIGQILPGWKPQYSLEEGLKRYIQNFAINEEKK